VLGPTALYALWLTTAALPFARRALSRATPPQGSAASRWHTAWTAVPATLVVVHLCAVGYIHSIDFRLAFVAPLLVGLVATSRLEDRRLQLLLPGIAALLSLDQGAIAGSPVRLAAAGTLVSWTYLAWLHRDRWLAALAVGCGATAVLGPHLPAMLDLAGRPLGLLGRLLPRSTFAWGTLTVGSAFVLLLVGALRSLRGTNVAALATHPRDRDQRRKLDS
jgi:hypothetical protein